MKLAVLIALCLLNFQVYAECVILLHGLARTESSMEEMQQKLSTSGFDVINLGYPSTEYPIEILAEKAIRPALAECPNNSGVNFVTHSLGGILVRQYLSQHEIPELDRVVMLGPPNKGSEVVDELADTPGFHFINGDAGLQLGTGDLSVPNSLGAADFDVGIIAGNESINLILSTFIPDDNDGKVSVERTKLDGMRDHLVMPVTHTFMMQNDDVIEQVIYYLKNGKFERE
ncbi:MAG: hypothetical protein V7711_06315 [Pseudomonadales bacterium]